MKTLVLVFHPNLTASRVNRVFSEAIKNESEVIVRDMYAIYPDGKIDVAREHDYLLEADRIVLQFPFYWYSSPSLLKEWQDEVLVYGWAFGENGNQLKDKELLVAATTGAEGYSRDGAVSYTVEELLRPFQATSNLIGTRYVKPFIINKSTTINESEIEQAAMEYAAYALSSQLVSLGAYE